MLLVEGDPALLNVFSIVPVDERRVPGVDLAARDAFVAWLLGADAQRLIADFGRAEHGAPLFVARGAIPPGDWA